MSRRVYVNGNADIERKQQSPERKRLSLGRESISVNKFLFLRRGKPEPAQFRKDDGALWSVNTCVTSRERSVNT